MVKVKTAQNIEYVGRDRCPDGKKIKCPQCRKEVSFLHNYKIDGKEISLCESCWAEMIS